MAEAPGGVAEDAVNRALGQMDAVLDAVVGRPTWAMTPDQQRQALVALARVESRGAALRLAVVAQAEADAVGVDAGATSTAAWHADATGQTPAQAFRFSRQTKKRAAQQTRFTMSDDGQGCVHGRFTLPAAVGAMLRTALEAIAAPKHQTATGGPDGHLRDATGERKPRPLRLGEAFCEYGVIPFVLGGNSQVLDAGR